jgi:hypothetical protein
MPTALSEGRAVGKSRGRAAPRTKRTRPRSNAARAATCLRRSRWRANPTTTVKGVSRRPGATNEQCVMPTSRGRPGRSTIAQIRIPDTGNHSPVHTRQARVSRVRLQMGGLRAVTPLSRCVHPCRRRSTRESCGWSASGAHPSAGVSCDPGPRAHRSPRVRRDRSRIRRRHCEPRPTRVYRGV